MKWCNNCNSHKESWAEHPGYNSSDTYRRYDRCWSCDKWTLCCHHGCHGCCDHGTSEALREANQRNSSLNSQNSSLQGQLSSKIAEVAGKDTQIAFINDNLRSTQKELEKKENQLVERDKRIETLGGLFNDLKIESNNKDKEIEKKDKNIEILKGALDKSQEEVLNYKLREQERKMDELISQLGIRRVQVRELRIFYQKLIRARINYNETDINTADDKIETIKDELLDGGVSVENAQKLCRKSERIAKIRIEQGEIQKKQWQQQQQQYQAQQEQPTNNN